MWWILVHVERGRSAPAQSNAISANLKPLHTGDGSFCVLPLLKLNKPTALIEWDFHLNDVPERLEQLCQSVLWHTRAQPPNKNCCVGWVVHHIVGVVVGTGVVVGIRVGGSVTGGFRKTLRLLVLRSLLQGRS